MNTIETIPNWHTIILFLIFFLVTGNWNCWKYLMSIWILTMDTCMNQFHDTVHNLVLFVVRDIILNN